MLYFILQTENIKEEQMSQQFWKDVKAVSRKVFHDMFLVFIGWLLGAKMTIEWLFL